MANRDFNLRLGVAKDVRDYDLNGFASDSQWIRLSGTNIIAQGGFQKRSTYQMSGIARGGLEFATSDGSVYAAIGTHKRLYIHSATYVQNVTPSESTGVLLNNPFATINGSAVVTVTHAAHGRRNGDWVYLGNAATFNGLTVGGSSGNLPAAPFTTSNGSPIVQVTHLAHGMSTNDEVNFTGATVLNNITITGVYIIRVLSANTYQIYGSTSANASGSGGGTPAYSYRRGYVITYVDANNYTVTDVATATGTGVGGGAAVAYLYELSSGLVDGVSGTGYSTGGYSAGPYSVSFAGATITYNPRTWSFAPYGNTLIANPAGGKIYEWTQNWSLRATQVTNSPAKCLFVIVTAQRQIIACGCTTESANFDPMMLRWCDLVDRTIWTAAQDNNAGNAKLALGSNIICASKGDSGSLVWTDQGFYFLTYTGTAGNTYRADLIAPNFGICGPMAFLDLGKEVYWVTPRLSFARYRGGAPEELECKSKIWFAAQSAGQPYKICAFYDQKFPAVSFLFPKSSKECDTYIRTDTTLENGDGVTGWSIGTVDRTFWMDTTIMPYPLAVASTGYLYEHEVGNSADGAALTRSMTFPDLLQWNDQLGQRDRVVNINKMIVSADVTSGSLGVYFNFKRYPNGPTVTKPTTGTPFAWTNSSQYLSVRGQGRAMGLQLISTSTNDNWTCGSTWNADASAGPHR